jgi:NAD-dependent dihydropyrimidine dehydrogenase PreA subunit
MRADAQSDHPTIRSFFERLRETPPPAPPPPLDANWLRQLCLDSGADDVGFVSIDRPELERYRGEILGAFSATRTLISVAVRMNRQDVRSPARSVANVEFHHATHQIDEIGHQIVRALEAAGVRAMNPSAGFPMEMDRFPGKIWVVSHKPIAVAAGLGKMGVNRNVIHPRFGNFVVLGTVLVDATIAEQSRPIDYNPCLDCNLCVAACPVGAIEPDGRFNFATCATHNYREFLGGFTDWVSNIADSPDGRAYREKVSDGETVSMWQSLSFGANYKAAYCMAVCPAGEEVIPAFLLNRKQFTEEVVRPLQKKTEPVYVVAGSDGEAHVRKRFPHKTVRHVHSHIRAGSIAGLLTAMPSVFQRTPSAGLDATYHFIFTGAESRQATVRIRDQQIVVEEGQHGTADLQVTADAATWLACLAKKQNMVWAILRRKIKLRGPIRLLRAFARCFPS